MGLLQNVFLWMIRKCSVARPFYSQHSKVGGLHCQHQAFTTNISESGRVLVLSV